MASLRWLTSSALFVSCFWSRRRCLRPASISHVTVRTSRWSNMRRRTSWRRGATKDSWVRRATATRSGSRSGDLARLAKGQPDRKRNRARFSVWTTENSGTIQSANDQVGHNPVFTQNVVGDRWKHKNSNLCLIFFFFFNNSDRALCKSGRAQGSSGKAQDSRCLIWSGILLKLDRVLWFCCNSWIMQKIFPGRSLSVTLGPWSNNSVANVTIALT